MTTSQIMTKRTVIVAKLFPYCFCQQHFSCPRRGSCPTPVLSVYSADGSPLASFLYVSSVGLFFLLAAPFTCHQGVSLSEYVFKKLHAKTNFAFITVCLSASPDAPQVMTWDLASSPRSSAINNEIMCRKLTLCLTLADPRRRISRCVCRVVKRH